MAMGFSWAHVLGDAFSASQCFNTWGHFLSGQIPTTTIPIHSPSLKGGLPIQGPSPSPSPLSIKQIGASTDHWVCPLDTPLHTFTLSLSPSQLSRLLSTIGYIDDDNAPVFESICVALWQMIARIREDDDPRVVTVVRDDESGTRVYGSLSNSQRITVVRAESSVSGADPRELLGILVGRKGDENTQIEEVVEKDDGVGDFVVYGANLTFVNLEECDFYGLKFNGHEPMFVNYVLQSVGDQGVVLVLPGQGNDGNGRSGRVVSIILPEKQLVELRGDLMKKKITV